MSTLPPGPSGRLLSTYRILARPFEYLPHWLARYGDPFTTRTFNGTVVVTANPEGARAVFSAPPDHFVPFATQALSQLVGAHSLFTLDGDRHRRERKLLMPPFHGERMRAYAGIMADVAVRHLARVSATGRFRMQDAAQDISLEVIIRAIFGVQEPERTRAFAEAVVALTESMSPALAFMPFLQREFGGFGPYARMRRRFEHLDVLLQEQLERTRQHPGEDILSLMLAARYEDGTPMRDDHIRDELRTLLFAGHETTALSLAWTVDLVHRHPAVLARLQAELDELGPDVDPERYAALPYLDAVCKEAMRLYPVVTEVPRMLGKPLRLGEYEIPAGAGVAPAIMLIHRRPDIYPEPELFRPERFLDFKPSPFEYLPFGGGHRRCIGAAFASFEMRVVLGAALTQWQVKLLDAAPPVPVRRTVTMAPQGGVPVALVSRQAGRAAA